ncbi:MAG: hypothetical protein IKX54_01260 [Lachnospiraceae bacterium]|nr:hypothetical protein [Lachnospiraceae bacterium]
MRNKAATVLFCVLLFGGLLAGILTKDLVYSSSEKRKLAQFPALSLSTLRSGDFGRQLETYLADQFPARDRWVTVKALAERTLGKKDCGGVYFAKDGYLIEIQRSFPTEQLTANLNAVKALSGLVAEDGVSVRIMPVPSAACILADKLPAYAANADQRAVIALAKNAGLTVIDVTDELLAHRDEYIYYKTDHHWTSLGAYYAYRVWMRERGFACAPLSEWARETLTDIFRGTTYIKSGDPFAPYDTIEGYRRADRHTVNYNNGYYIADSIFERSLVDGQNPYGVFLNGNQSTTVVFSEGRGKLLIIKDSYANTFAQFAVDDHEETHLIDMRFFRGSVAKYIRDNGITEVLVLYNIPNLVTDVDLARVGR